MIAEYLGGSPYHLDIHLHNKLKCIAEAIEKITQNHIIFIYIYWKRILIDLLSCDILKSRMILGDMKWTPKQQSWSIYNATSFHWGHLFALKWRESRKRQRLGKKLFAISVPNSIEIPLVDSLQWEQLLLFSFVLWLSSIPFINVKIEARR